MSGITLVQNHERTHGSSHQHIGVAFGYIGIFSYDGSDTNVIKIVCDGREEEVSSLDEADEAEGR